MNTVFYKEENNHYCYVGYLLEELNTHGWKMVKEFCLRRSCWIVAIFRLMKNEVFWLDSLSYCLSHNSDLVTFQQEKFFALKIFFNPYLTSKKSILKQKL